MDLVYGVCLKYLKDPANAQDAVMNIFEELITKVQKHTIDNFKPWLYSVAKNHCLMKIRSDKKLIKVNVDTEFMQSEPEWHLNGELEKEEHFRQLEQCIEQLTTEQRQVIELFYLQNKCYNEITAITGLEWNAVRSSIQNGRRNLKICMENSLQKL